MQLNKVEVISIWPSPRSVHSFSGKNLRAVYLYQLQIVLQHFFSCRIHGHKEYAQLDRDPLSPLIEFRVFRQAKLGGDEKL